MSDELTNLLKDIANRDLLKAEIETLENKRKLALDEIEANRNNLFSIINRLKNEEQLLEKQISVNKKEVERLEKEKVELQLHCEKERKKINDVLADIEKEKIALQSKKDELLNLQTEAASRVAIVYQREELVVEKESKINAREIANKEQEAKLLKLKGDLETLRNENRIAENNAKKIIEEANKLKNINQQELERIVNLLKDLDNKRAEIVKLDRETQEKIAISDAKLKEITERETKIAKSIENIENRERQLEIDNKNLNLVKIELELKEKIVKEKLITLGVK